MAKTSNPYGLSLFEYKGSNFSGTLANYPLSTNGTVVNNLTSSRSADTTGLASIVTGIYSGDLVTFAPSSAGLVPNATSSGAFVLPGTSLGYLVLANSPIPNAIPTSSTGNNTSPRSILGVFQGVNGINTGTQNTRSMFFTQNTVSINGVIPYATVNDLPDCIFQIQCNAALGSTLASAMANIGNLFGFANNGGGNPANGQSTLTLDVNSEFTTTSPTSNVSGAPFRLIGLAPIQGNSWTDPYPDVLVMINNHMWKRGQF